MKKLMIIAITVMGFNSFVKAQNKMEVSYSILKEGKETEVMKQVGFKMIQLKK